MKNLISLVLMVLLLLPFAVSFAEARDCCVMAEETGVKCTYWDMTEFSNGEKLCTNLALWGYVKHSAWYPNEISCESIANLPSWCEDPRNGWEIPEFSAGVAVIALVGSITGFFVLRRKK